MAKQKTFTVGGSHGELHVIISSGRVAERFNNAGCDDYDTIERFDVKEYRRYYGRTPEEGEYVDILDIGFWTKEGKYEPAEEEHREDFNLKENCELSDKRFANFGDFGVQFAYEHKDKTEAVVRYHSGTERIAIQRNTDAYCLKENVEMILGKVENGDFSRSADVPEDMVRKVGDSIVLPRNGDGRVIRVKLAKTVEAIGISMKDPRIGYSPRVDRI